MATSFGNVLRHCRAMARYSQMALALEAGVSTRHLSFLESGRAEPGREVVARLAAALRLAEAARTALFVSAGFAPVSGEDAKGHGTAAIERLLLNLDPHPSALAGPGGIISAVNCGMQALHAEFTGLLRELRGMTASELALGQTGLGPYLSNRDGLARRFAHCNVLQALMAGGVSAETAAPADGPAPSRMCFTGDFGELAFDLVELSDGRLFQGAKQTWRIYTMIPCDAATDLALTAIAERVSRHASTAAPAETGT